MCGRITMLTSDEIADAIQAIRKRRASRLVRADDAAQQTAMRSQAKPGSVVSVIARDAKSLYATDMTWGIIAPWGNKLVFNTRLESALGGTAMWKGPIREGRCILPAATFFEPHATEMTKSPRTGRPVKQSYEFALPGDEPLLLASVSDQGHLSVVTTEPNATVSPIHPRMPLILRFEEAPLWLEGGIDDIAQLADRSAIALVCAKEALGRHSASNAQSRSADAQTQLQLEF